MTDSEQSFGSAVTPPHRPQPLSVPTYGEETHPAHAEESHPPSGEGMPRPSREGLVPRSIESEASHQSSSTSGGRTSAFIVGENREERYRCDICGKEFGSEGELTRHVKRIGIIE